MRFIMIDDVSSIAFGNSRKTAKNYGSIGFSTVLVHQSASKWVYTVDINNKKNKETTL